MCKKFIVLLFCASVLFSSAARAELDDSGRLIVPKTSVAPVINGELDDVWQDASEESILTTEIINAGGNIPPDDDSDLSGTFKVMYDDDNFYFFLGVQDSVLDFEFSDWQGDSVEIYFDGDNSKGGAYDGVNDNQIRINTDDVALGDTSSSLPIDGTNFAVLQTDTGYNIEAAFPLAVLQLVPEQTFGFEVQLNDNDGGGARETMIRWFSNDNNSWQDSSLFGEAVLAVEEEVPAGPTIIWVTDAYDDNADGAPDDLEWKDILEAEGYSVDYQYNALGDGYWRTLDDVKIAALNAADLIIVSRNSDSGNYDDDNEIAQWNSITTPIILSSTHIVRSSRWKWVDSTTILSLTPTMVLADGTEIPGINAEVGPASFIDAAAGNGTITATGDGLPFIIEWEAGVEYYDGAGEIAGGPRVFFVAGTQETAPEVGRGEMNLAPEALAVFLDTVKKLIPVKPVDPGSDGLVAFYALDGDSNDSSGNELHGTLVGDPAFVEGKVDMALDLDGTDDVVELGKFDVDGHITLAAWIKADDFEINDARIITKANEWGGNDHWWMLSTISETSLRFRLKTDDGADTATLISDPVLEAGVFAHVAATWDGSMMRIYKDGVEVASQEKGGTAVAVDPDVSAAIGSQPSDAFASDPSHVVKFFDGLIDEVVIYNRALSEGEILYLAGHREYTFNGDALDDTWDHDNGSDAWDETGIGEGNPGGASLLSEDGVDFLRIQDTGDPRDLGISDPSNRKVYLTRLTDLSLDGLHLEVRMRVATTAPLDDQLSGEPWPAEGIGYHIRDNGKGMIGVSDGVGLISFSLGQAGEADYPDATTDLLVMNNLVGTEPSDDVDTGDTPEMNAAAVEDAAQWNTFVIDIVAGGAGTHIVTVSANGRDAVSFEVTTGSGLEADGAYITIGSSGTGGITAFDVDYLKVSN